MLKTILTRLLREAADKIDAGNCEMSEQEMIDAVRLFAHEPLSKDRACALLGVSRATFDNYIRNGWLPEGKKRIGFKELAWYRDELEIAINSMRNSQTHSNL